MLSINTDKKNKIPCKRYLYSKRKKHHYYSSIRGAFVNQTIWHRACFSFHVTSGKDSFPLFEREQTPAIKSYLSAQSAYQEKKKAHIHFISLKAWLKPSLISGPFEWLFLCISEQICYSCLWGCGREIKLWCSLVPPRKKAALEIHDLQEHSFVLRELQTAKIIRVVLNTQNVKCFISAAAEIK